MLPVLGREVVEREQFVQVIDDLRDGLGVLDAVGGLELLDRPAGMVEVFSVPDLSEVLLRSGVRRLREGPSTFAIL